MTRMYQRLSGCLIMSAVLFSIDVTNDSVLHALVLPLLLAFAAFLVTQSLMAVALAAFMLAAGNADLGAASWITGLAYPAIAIVAVSICLAIGAIRFRDRIAATRDERWSHRRRRS